MNALSAKTRDRLLYMISPILFLGLWQLLLMAGLGDRRFVPAPTCGVTPRHSAIPESPAP